MMVRDKSGQPMTAASRPVSIVMVPPQLPNLSKEDEDIIYNVHHMR